jgi:DnaJ-class molecular chaperone
VNVTEISIGRRKAMKKEEKTKKKVVCPECDGEGVDVFTGTICFLCKGEGSVLAEVKDSK